MLEIPTAIADQVARVREILEHQLGAALRALHLFGSAVDGGLRPFSDIDLLASVDAPLPDSLRRALMRALLEASAPPGAHPTLRALEVTVVVHAEVVPWRYAPRRELQFGEWLRDDLFAGIVEPAVADPDLAILLTQARQRSVALIGPAADAWFAPVPARDLVRAYADTLEQWREPADWAGDERNVVLALARIWYSATTGAIAPKDVAAAWLLPRLPAGHRFVLEQARRSYLGEPAEGLERHEAPTAAFVAHARQAIAPWLDVRRAGLQPPNPGFGKSDPADAPGPP